MKHKWLFVATIGTAVIVAPITTDASFKDVKDPEMQKAVQSLVDRNVMTLYTDGSFKPNKELTRSEVAKIIARALNLDTTNVKDPKLKDVPNTHGNYKYIAAVAQAGIMTGYNGVFNPGKGVTRGQIAKVLTEAYDLQLTKDIFIPFTDVKGDDIRKYVKTLYVHNITQGSEPTRFGVNNAVRRGQLALFIHRVENLKALVPYDQTVTGTEVKLHHSQFDVHQIRVANESSYYNDGVIEATLNEGGDEITFKPLKEGKANFVISGFSVDTDGENYYHYQFDVKKVNGKLEVTMSYQEDFLDYPVMLDSGGYKGVELFDLAGNKVDTRADIVEFDEETQDVWVLAPEGFYTAKLTRSDNTVVEKMYYIFQDPVFATANEITYFAGDEIVLPLAKGISDVQVDTYIDGVTYKISNTELRIKSGTDARLNITYSYNGDTKYLTADIYKVGNGMAIAEYAARELKDGPAY